MEKKILRQSSFWIFGITIFSFIFLRLYRLPETLYFWGDIGRDHEMLMEMVQERKPTLLGPGNSQLPFNQSAWYFYLNLPVFILTSYSPLTTAFTGIGLNIIASFILFRQIKNDQSSQKVFTKLVPFIFFSLLYLFHPFVLEQQRSTWNPAFAVPFLIVGIGIFWKLLDEGDISKKFIVLSALCFSFAVGMTYAVIPILFFVILMFLFSLPKEKRLFFLSSLVGSFLIVFLPHILFELRYDFLLTKQVLQFERSNQTVPFLSLIDSGLVQLVGFKEVRTVSMRAVFIILILLVVGIFQLPEKRKKNVLKLIFIFVCSYISSTLFIDEFHSHYVLGFIVLFLFIVMNLPEIWKVLIAMVLLFYWSGIITTEFTRAPHRTISDLETCAEKVCAQYTEPMYLSAQAWHDFHSGYDYSFFFNKHGCFTRDISTNPGMSDKMLVVADKADFDPATTAYHELTLFGEKELQDTILCGENMRVYQFKKQN